MSFLSNGLSKGPPVGHQRRDSAVARCRNLIQLSYNSAAVAHILLMSTEKPILEHSDPTRQRALDPSEYASDPGPQQLAARRVEIVVAAIDSDLRASSAKANFLLSRSAAAVSTTTELIAHSREAIALSRILLNGGTAPSREDRRYKRR